MIDLKSIQPKQNQQEYHIRYIGHVNPRTRPDGWPDELSIDMHVRVNSTEALKELVNKNAGALISPAGLLLLKPNAKAEIDGEEISFDKRMLVPWHLLTHYDCIVTPIVGHSAEIIDGKPVLEDGTEVKVS